jgi:Carboxypeptidase regulatory-like domain/TonB dependent receptor
MKRQLPVLILMVFVSFVTSRTGIAQSSFGRLSGQVTDASGGTVSDATVTIENLGNHTNRVMHTNAAGEYVAPDLEPGHYSITVEATGFGKLERRGIRLEVAEDFRVDFQLKPGAVSETVEVKDEAPLTEATNAVLNGVLSNQAINELPLQGRDFQNLLPLHPGVQRDPGGGFHTLTSNGNRPDDNNFLIDGANDNDVYYGETVMNDAGISGTPASTLPLDAIQEFNTQEQPQADFGAKPGVVVNIGIKSGTDAIHGSAYYFHRNSAFDARNYYNSSPEPFSALLLHQFGASIGGPIIKGKWFYFANYEGVRDKVGNPFDADSPVTSSLVGRVDPTEFDVTQYSIVDAEAAAGCNMTPSPCNPLSLNLVKLFPKNPGLLANPADPSGIDFDFNNTNREDNLVVKSDFHLNDKNTFSGRFIYANTQEIEEDTTPIAPQWLSTAAPTTQVFGLDWTWTPNSRWVNDARFSYNRFYEKIAPVDANVSSMTYGINTGVTDPRLFGFPSINPDFNTFNSLGGNSSWPLWTTPSRTENYSDTATFSRGKHSFRFGGVFTHGDVNYFRAGDGRGQVEFDSLSDYLMGNVDSWAFLYGDSARDVSLKSFGLFAQDDYRVTRRVTLNMGLRYEVTYPIKDSRNLLANFLPTQGLVQVGDGINQPYKTNYNNFSPRLGVAWDVFGTGKTVLRSGFGMIFIQPSIRTFMFNGGGLNLNPSGVPKIISNTDGTTTTIPGTGSLTTFLVTGADPSLINWSLAGPIFPTGTSASSCSSAVPCTVFGVDPNLHTPYVLQWNLNVQQVIAPNTLLQVAYVGNRGVKLYSITDPNQADPAISTSNPDFELFSDNSAVEQMARPYTTNCPTTVLGGLGRGGPCFPYLGFFNFLGNQSSSIYHGLQVTLTKKYSKGLYLLAGYTFSHAIDTAGETSNLADVPQNSLNYAGERGSGDYDIRHRFTLSATYELPSIKSKAQLLEGWQINTLITVQGGYPMEFYDASDDFTGTGEGFNNDGNDRWNILGNPYRIQWGRDATAKIPFVEPGDAAYGSCLAAANTPGLMNSLVQNGGCFVQNGTILYPNAVGTYGNMGRNIFRGPGFADWDGSLGKVWNLSERLRLQFRGEVFNVLNHPIFSLGSIRKNLGSTNLGYARGTPDVWASNPVIGSGGSRHIQLGLKLLW